MRSATLACLGAGAMLALAAATQDGDDAGEGAAGDDGSAAYWIGRMEAALLPQSSLRTEARITTREGPGVEQKTQLRIARVQGPARLRTLVTIREEDESARIERVVFDDGRLERTVFHAGAAEPVRLPVSRTRQIGETEFTYEDLAFADFSPRERGTVERREAHDAGATPHVPGHARGVVEITSTDAWEGDGKVVTLLSEETALPLEVQFYDDHGQMFRTLRFGDFREVGPYTYPQRAEVRNRRSGRSSTLELFDTLLGPRIYEAEFSGAQIRKRLRVLAEKKPNPPLF